MFRLIVILLLIAVIFSEAQYRIMANYGPAWRQKLWRQTRIPYNDAASRFDNLNLNKC